jgi:hypothetical protein
MTFARWFACLVLCAASLLAGAAHAGDEPPRRIGLSEQVDVGRIVVDIHPVEPNGRIQHDLRAADLAVRIGGVEARIDALEWVPGRREGETADFEVRSWSDVPAEAATGQPLPGRLLVLVFQRHLHPSRIVGLIKLRPHLDALFEQLVAQDRVAVLGYSPYTLSLYADFTNDWDHLRDLIPRHVVRYRPPQPQPQASAGFPSLARHLDRERAQDADTPEQALELIGEALAPLPGQKSVVFFGWGLGRLLGGRPRPRPEYHGARHALLEARATVYSIDVAQADYHSLEGPLALPASDTGGFYAKAFRTQGSAFRRLHRALAGHYVLTVVKPDLPAGRHRLRVELVDRKGWVRHPPFVSF